MSKNYLRIAEKFTTVFFQKIFFIRHLFKFYRQQPKCPCCEFSLHMGLGHIPKIELWMSYRPPSKKFAILILLELFLPSFFAISRHMGPNTCSNVMILHPKHNFMLLNTFLRLISCLPVNDFYAFLTSRNQIDHQKIDFLMISFDFLTLRTRKNDFIVKSMLETCSVKSKYV